MKAPGCTSRPFSHCAGTALSAAILVPNVEFIFGLTGSTASVVIAYILPVGAAQSPKLCRELYGDFASLGGVSKLGTQPLP